MEIKSVSRSRFDWLFDNSVKPEVGAWNAILAEDANGISLPSKGSLVPGWILVLPKHPVLNLAALTKCERQGLQQLASNVERKIAKFADRIFEFEHGAGKIGSVVGCGVDLAHLHAVPLDFDLIEELRAHTAGNVKWQIAENISDPWQEISSNEYIVVREPDRNRAVIGVPEHAQSQLIRRVIAKCIGEPQSWDYRDHPYSSNVEATLGAFGINR